MEKFCTKTKTKNKSDKRNIKQNGKTCSKTKLQVLGSSWDGRPFGHNRHGPIGRCCDPFGDRRRSKAEATAGHTKWHGMARHSLPNNYFRGQEM